MGSDREARYRAIALDALAAWQGEDDMADGPHKRGRSAQTRARLRDRMLTLDVEATPEPPTPEPERPCPVCGSRGVKCVACLQTATEATWKPERVAELWTRDTGQQAIRDLYYYAEGSRDENLLRLANRIRFAVPAAPGRCLWRERDGMWWPACGKSDVGMEISLVEHFNCCTGCGRPVQVEK